MSTNDEWLEVKMRLQGARQFISEIGGAAAGVAGFGVASEEAAAKAKLSRVETFAWRQGLFTLRRELFYGTAAAGAFGLATLKLGLSFDEAKTQGTEAFTAIFGSSRLANVEMNRLVGLSHETGVQLGILTTEAEQMQGFGFTVKQINVYMAALANYAERSGRGAAGLFSLVEVFDRIRQRGQLTSLDLRTLTMQGIPALRILSQQLNLTAQQRAALQQGKLIIPSQFALPALASGIGARADLLGTNLGQQLGITHSFLGSIFGGGEQGIFSFATHGLERINAALKARSGGGSFLQTLNPSGDLLAGWRLLTAAVRGFFAPLAAVYRVGHSLLTDFPLLTGILRGLARQTWLVEAAMFALATWFLVTRTRMLLFVGATKLVGVAETAYIVLLYALDAAMAILSGDITAAAVAMGVLDAAFLLNPITWIVLGVVALGAAFYLLGTHLKEVARWAKDAWGWIKHFVFFGWLFGGGGGGDVTGQSFTRTATRGSQRPLAALPRGVQTRPVTKAGGLLGGMALHLTSVPGDINLDGRKVAESTFDWQARLGARA